MAKITFEIQFGNLNEPKTLGMFDFIKFKDYKTNSNHYSNRKKHHINNIISAIEKRLGCECDEFDFDDNIIESFFDVYYTYIEKPDNSVETVNEIKLFLNEIGDKYSFADLRYYESEQSFTNDDD